jgi:hypothetical protein
MDISEKQLQALIHGHIVGEIGDVAAFKNGSKNLVKGFLRDTVDELRGIQGTRLEVENSSYGSGYASFWDVFCHSSNATRIQNKTTSVSGVTLYLCRLAPVVVLGSAEKTKSKNASSGGFLRPADLEPAPVGWWVDAIRTKLEQRGFILPSQKFFRQPLPFEARVKTILGDPPYTVFDAFFYWED